MNLNPYIKAKKNSVSAIMFDVIIALMPLVLAAYAAFGFKAIWLITTAVITCLITDFLFNALYAKKYNSFLDGSAMITALLLSFTVSPLTPWYVLAFGSFCAIVFGKLLWGGLGKNRFNPALVGREFMTAFFPLMSTAAIWSTNSIRNTKDFHLFANDNLLGMYSNDLVFKTTGALGEYSMLFIVLGGLYLIIRKRISWHIPFAILTVFLCGTWLSSACGLELKYSIAGMILGSIFMATDMPSSPNGYPGMLYYGGMIGLVSIFFILGNVRFEYLSYAILLLNGFTPFINQIFRPRAWGEKVDYAIKTEKIFFLTLAIIAAAMAILTLHYYGFIKYLIYIYIVYITFKFNFSFIKNIHNPI